MTDEASLVLVLPGRNPKSAVLVFRNNVPQPKVLI